MVKRKISTLLLIGLILGLCACTQNEPKQTTSPMKKINKQVEKVNLPKIEHIVIVVEENHSKSQITDNASAPYINSLMKEGANFTNFHAIEHPSQPNYLDLFSGSNQGVTNDRVPSSRFSSANLGSELIEKNYTFTGFSEGLPSIGFNGETTGKGEYARKHNPWVNFTNLPKELNQPLTSFPKDFSKLPTVSFVIPTLKNDMHDGTIQEADQWLRAHLDPYVQWAKTNNSLLIVTWDENEGTSGNTIPTFFVGPMVKKGQFTASYNHFNLLRTIEDIYGLSHAGAAKTSVPITGIWQEM
jgi:hypothetical protein